ncbi:MAG: hypothetical protein M1522_06765 [Actinobacteria bacterium]|nr:hypothetical protein [Actinomycetota bacterium]
MSDLDLPPTMLDAAQQAIYERSHLAQSARETARQVLVAAGVPGLIAEVERLHDVIARCDGELDEAHAVIVEQGREVVQLRKALTALRPKGADDG